MEKKIVFNFYDRIAYGKKEWVLQVWIEPNYYGLDKWVLYQWEKKPNEKEVEKIKKALLGAMDFYHRNIKIEKVFKEIVDWK
jgi:hypothetical protein